MARAMKDLKVGDGSIKIGATGTVSALMMLELDSAKLTSNNSSVSCKRKPQTAPVSVSCGASTKRLHPRRASSDCSNNTNRRKLRDNRHTAQSIPMLGYEDIPIDITPSRGKDEKKGCQIVEIVDLKCGNVDRAWSSPISSQLKKLSFSRLSD